MVAMPTAPAAPDRKDVGSDQNSGAQVNTPAAATESATRATAVLLTKEAATMKPPAPISAGMTRCQRRSRRASALRPKRFIATMAHPKGMALNRPMLRLATTPVVLISVGIQK